MREIPAEHPLAPVWRWRYALLIAAILIGVGVFVLRHEQRPSYRAVAGVQITGTVAGQSVDSVTNLTNLYLRLSTTTPVLRLAARYSQLDPDELRDHITTSAESEVAIIRLAATSRSPRSAARLANAYARAFTEFVGNASRARRRAALLPVQEEIARVQSDLGKLQASDTSAARQGLLASLQALETQAAETASQPQDAANLVETAGVPATPSSPRPRRDGVLAALLSLGLMAGLLALRHRVSDRFGSGEQASTELGLQLLAEVPRFQHAATFEIENVRLLRLSVLYALERTAREAGVATQSGHLQPGGPVTGALDLAATVLVTSADASAGKSFITEQLGRALAIDGHKVLVVDGDLRRPTLHQRFGARRDPGLSDLLLAGAHDGGEQFVVPAVSSPTLSVLPAGPPTDGAAELLSSSAMRRIIDSARLSYGLVVLDSPPVNGVVDPLVLAPYADGIVFVVDAKSTRRSSARRAVESLRAVDAPLLGMVYNRSPTHSSGGAYYTAYTADTA